jgi:hypothetical protein
VRGIFRQGKKEKKAPKNHQKGTQKLNPLSLHPSLFSLLVSLLFSLLSFKVNERERTEVNERKEE